MQLKVAQWVPLIGAASAVTIPGAYYYIQTKRDQAQVIENKKEADSFRPFVQGAVYGAVPPLNVYCMGLVALSTLSIPIRLLESLGDWVDHKESSPEKESSLSKERKLGIPERYPGPVGFLSGLALWVPYALDRLKRIR